MLPPYFHPRTWSTWLLFGIARILVLLPYPLLMIIGEKFGNLIAFLLPIERLSILEKNLKLCFPALSKNQRTQLAQHHIGSMGKGLVEVALAWWGNRKKLESLVHIEGLKYLKIASKANKGVILLSAHFTSLEIGARLLALYYPFNVFYRPSDNAVIAYLMQLNRTRHFESAILKNNIKEMIRIIKNGRTIWYAPDQNFSSNPTFSPFFGIYAATNNSTARIAKITGALVVPFIPVRRKNNSGYNLKIYPALKNFPVGDNLKDTTRINAIFESWAKQYPEDYFWFHRRFKLRPKGEPSLY